MADTFPCPTNSGPPFRYPITRTLAFKTIVQQYLDDTETRWSTHYRMERFQLKWPRLKYVDLMIIWNFFNNMRGMSCDNQWSLLFDSIEYKNCSFDTDTFQYTEDFPERYTIDLPIKQIIPATFVTPPTGDDFDKFPAFLNGARFQRGYSAGSSFVTMISENPSSEYRYTQYQRLDPLGLWKVSNSVIVPEEALALENFFAWHQGRLLEFQFTDPFGNIIPRCRFGSDTLDLVYQDPSYFSVELLVQELPA